MADHPHAEAAYSLLTQADGTFAVEVLISGFGPTKVSGFDTQEKAEAWIERHRSNIATRGSPTNEMIGIAARRRRRYVGGPNRRTAMPKITRIAD